MNTKKHMKIAGALQIVQAVPSLLFGTYYAIAFIQGVNELHEIIVMSLILAVILLSGAVQVWFGVALIRQKQWTTRVIGLILSGLTCLSFPHITGIYTLVVLVQVNSMKAATTEPTIEAQP